LLFGGLRGKKHPMLYALFALNVFLAWGGFIYANTAVSLTFRVVFGLAYAFAPFLVALLSAWQLTKRPTTRKAFLTNLEITWSLMLVLAGLALVVLLEL
jgi:hypothetical protein